MARLTFLLDTGVAETSIFSLENKEIKLAMLKEKVSGLGGSASIDDFRSDNNIAKSERLCQYNDFIYHYRSGF
jgi:hypothetical protein